MTFDAYLEQDTQLKEMSEQLAKFNTSGNELRGKALKGLSGGATADDVALFHNVNEDLEKTAKAISARKSVLHLDWERDEEAAQGKMKTVNALGGAETAQKSLSQYILESPEIAKLPMKEIDGQVIKDFGAYKDTIRFEIAKKSFDPRNLLRDASRAQDIALRGMKDVVTGTFATLPMLQPTFVPTAVYPATIWELLPSFTMLNPTVTYRRETSHTNNAASTTEGSAPSQSTTAASLQTDTAYQIQGFFTVSEQELMSRPDIMDVLTFFARRDLGIAAETEILTGTGSAPHLNGIYTQATGTYAKGTYPDTNGNPENDIDAIAHAWLDLKVGGVCVPDMCIIHPNQFVPLRLTKDALGQYVYGPPSEPNPEMYLFGIRLMMSNYAVDGQALMGDFAGYYSLGIYGNIAVELGYNGNDWKNLERTLRFYVMLANQVRRPRAFETITGLTSAV